MTDICFLAHISHIIPFFSDDDPYATKMHQLANSTSKKESLPFNLPTIQSAAIKAKRTLAALNVIDHIFKLICKMATHQNDGYMLATPYFLFVSSLQ